MPEFTPEQLLVLARDALSNRPKSYKKGGTVEHKGVNITNLELSPQAVDGGAVFHPEHFASGGAEDSAHTEETENFAHGGAPHTPHPAMRIPGVHIVTSEAGEPFFHGGL